MPYDDDKKVLSYEVHRDDAHEVHRNGLSECTHRWKTG